MNTQNNSTNPLPDFSENLDTLNLRLDQVRGLLASLGLATNSRAGEMTPETLCNALSAVGALIDSAQRAAVGLNGAHPKCSHATQDGLLGRR
jgi:hypothetical protein